MIELPQDYWRKVDKAGPLWEGVPCWLWQGHVHRYGYGHYKWRQHTYRVHRLAYEALVGPIPTSYEVHHKCGNKRCVQPAHLEAMPKPDHDRLNAAAFQPKATWPPCVLCGTMGGVYHGTNVTPERISGARFGIDGPLCKRCYDRLWFRQRRAKTP